MKKIITLIFACLMLSSCETNIVHKYDCEGRHEMISKTLIECINASGEKNSLAENSIKKNDIYACKDVVEQLICKPEYKKITGPFSDD